MTYKRVFRSSVALPPCSYAHRVSIPSLPRAAELRSGHSSPLRKSNLASQRVFCTLIRNLKQQHLIQLRAMHIKIIIRHHQQTAIAIR